MQVTHSQAGFTNVVHHLKRTFQPLATSGAKARVGEKELIRSAERAAPPKISSFPVACFLVALFCAAFYLPSLLAEEIARIGTGAPPVPTEPRPVTQSAGLAFAGTVKAVEHVAAAGRNRIATTRITFHVDTAIRGVKAGQTLVITEWAGLWSSGERYRPGERVCLFLYPPSKLGLTSPVRGPAGRFRIRGPGRIVVPPGQRPILPQPIRTRLDANGEISAGDFARALRERSKP